MYWPFQINHILRSTRSELRNELTCVKLLFSKLVVKQTINKFIYLLIYIVFLISIHLTLQVKYIPLALTSLGKHIGSASGYKSLWLAIWVIISASCLKCLRHVSRRLQSSESHFARTYQVSIILVRISIFIALYRSTVIAIGNTHQAHMLDARSRLRVLHGHARSCLSVEEALNLRYSSKITGPPGVHASVFQAPQRSWSLLIYVLDNI